MELVSFRKHRILKVCMGLIAVVSTVGITGSASLASQTAKIHRGGTVSEMDIGESWPSLDPQNSSITSQNIMFAIYGGLFRIGKFPITITPDLATGYTYSDHNQTLTVKLRHGVVFSDGTPFNGAAVVASIERVLLPSNACTCDTDFKYVTSITSPNPYTVVFNQSVGDASLALALSNEAPNWIADPAAYASEGPTKFEVAPVGAGPFKVVSNTPNAEIEMTANSLYWEKGKPYIQNLDFLYDMVDATANAALQSGQIQIANNMSTVSLLEADKTGYNVHLVGQRVNDIEFNTKKAPLNNILAREALFYATNEGDLSNAIEPDGFSYVDLGPAGKHDPYYENPVPGFRRYNLAKAKALVQQLGGLSVTMQCAENTLGTDQCEAFQSMWANAGINLQLIFTSGTQATTDLDEGDYEILLKSSSTGYEDTSLAGFPTSYDCSSIQSAVCDPALDGLINKTIAVQPGSPSAARYFKQLFAYIISNAYSLYFYDAPSVIVSSRTLIGVNAATPIGLNGSPETQFQDIYYSS
jgi:peptide/nickel transport system substrate-binding protein